MTTIARRKLLAVLAGAATWPLAGRAQGSTKRPVVAWLGLGTQPGSFVFVDAFLQGMRELGYAEGRDFDIVYRFADGFIEQFPALADAVHLGLVASEARPGGNITGIAPYVAGLPTKQMELKGDHSREYIH